MLVIIVTNIKIWCCLFVWLCLWFNNAKTTKPISIKLSIKTAYIPGCDLGLFPYKHIYPFQDGSPFRDVPTCKIGTYLHST